MTTFDQIVPYRKNGLHLSTVYDFYNAFKSVTVQNTLHHCSRHIWYFDTILKKKSSI